MHYFQLSCLLFGQRILSAAFMHTSLEGHKTNAQYVGCASPSDSTFQPQTTKQNTHVATLKISAELNCIYPLDETVRSVTYLATGWRVGSVRGLSPS
jgi:hypothetical protein